MIADILLPRPRVAGRFTLVVTRPDGRRRVAAEFDNMVTDGGLERMGIGSFRDACVVGTGSAVPQEADAQLEAFRARSTINAPGIPGATAQSTPPYYIQGNTGFRFAQGAASGNLTEVGIGWALPGAAYGLFARALIVDTLGNPTAVTVLADEVLDVYYSLRIYPPTVDATYDIVISGVTYACISRAAQVTSAISWAVPAGRVQFTGFNGSNAAPLAYNGLVGPITGGPSGVGVANAGISNEAYSANSLRQDAVLSWGLDQGNVPGGIRSVLYQTSVGVYQTQFTPAIPKDNTMVLSVGFRVGWGRRP
jgi:hypothetical protein